MVQDPCTTLMARDGTWGFSTLVVLGLFSGPGPGTMGPKDLVYDADWSPTSMWPIQGISAEL
jgi:hypothetical protein